jgi:hypothetical protein
MKKRNIFFSRRAKREGMLHQVRRKAPPIGACRARFIRVYQLGHCGVPYRSFVSVNNIAACSFAVKYYFAKNCIAWSDELCHIY